jgi:hypothetical protein
LAKVGVHVWSEVRRHVPWTEGSELERGVRALVRIETELDFCDLPVNGEEINTVRFSAIL